MISINIHHLEVQQRILNVEEKDESVKYSFDVPRENKREKNKRCKMEQKVNKGIHDKFKSRVLPHKCAPHPRNQPNWD